MQYNNSPNKIMKCKYCNLEFDGTKSQFANHVRWCDKNPKAIEYREKNKENGIDVNNRKFGVIKEFSVVCECCGKDFNVKERENLFPQRNVYYCSRKCANSVGGKAKADKYHYDEVAHYRTIGRRYHDLKCVICGEENIVAIHHIDENHHNNDPKNLVPLCPTHHHYMHSKFKILIVEKVNEYLKSKWG